MTGKPPLYAAIAALALACPVAALAQAPERRAPPCIACVTIGVSVDDGIGLNPGAVALVVRPGQLGSVPASVWRHVRTAIVDLHGAGATPDEIDLVARKGLTAARAVAPGLRVGALGPVAAIDALLARDLAAYTDFVAVEKADEAVRARWVREHPGLSVWRAMRLDSFAALLNESAAAQGEPLLVWPAPPITAELLGDLERLAELFPQALVETAQAPVACAPADACRVRTFERHDTRETIVWLSRAGAGRAMATIDAPRAVLVAISTGPGASAGVADSVVALAPAVADASGRIRLYLPLTGVSSLIARIPAVSDRVIEDVRVVGARELSVAEIVARHQAQAARQQALVRTLVTHADSTVTFEVPAFPAPVTIQAETVMFQGDGPTELVQRNVTVNGVAFGGSGVPRLPIVEPERVAAPPLAITLSRSYRYRLEGRELVNGAEAYVVRFAAGSDERSLFAGRAWIDRATFALVRADATQTNLRGPITSSQQIDEFRAAPLDGEQVWLLARSETRQVYQGAGITTPVLRVVRAHRHEINPADLDKRRRAAYASSDLMLRDTAEGLRYLRRDGGTPPGERAVREVEGRATSVLTLAAGLIVDPNITRPLPFAGVNYTDFDLAGTGTQLNAFFGGAYGQVAFNVPSILGSRWQLAGSGFAMLARYNDRAFRGGRERYDENLRQRPVHASAGLVRALTPRTSVRAEYIFDWTLLEASDTTSAVFVVPADQVVHAARLVIETQRAGWRVEGWWSPARRVGWGPWGFPESGDYDAEHGAFQRFGASGARAWVVSQRVLVRLDLAAMGGADLDRFSRYAFGTFDNRLRGYPSASIRYDRGAVGRGAIVWQPGGRIRIDGFADAALVRETGFGRTLRGYPGVGAALEAAGPFSLLLGAEWGYGIKGIRSDGSRGTHVIRFSAYKVF